MSGARACVRRLGARHLAEPGPDPSYPPRVDRERVPNPADVGFHQCLLDEAVSSQKWVALLDERQRCEPLPMGLEAFASVPVESVQMAGVAVVYQGFVTRAEMGPSGEPKQTRQVIDQVPGQCEGSRAPEQPGCDEVERVLPVRWSAVDLPCDPGNRADNGLLPNPSAYSIKGAATARKPSSCVLIPSTTSPALPRFTRCESLPARSSASRMPTSWCFSASRGVTVLPAASWSMTSLLSSTALIPSAPLPHLRTAASSPQARFE